MEQSWLVSLLIGGADAITARSNYSCVQMSGFHEFLGVSELSVDDVKGVHSKVKESGSDLPRVLLAFYFAILRTIEKYSTSTFCPIILDSPKQ